MGAFPRLSPHTPCTLTQRNKYEAIIAVIACGKQETFVQAMTAMLP
jgi:hypothetical protein